MPKGPSFLEGNVKRHHDRNAPWYKKTATVDVDKLRVQLSIEYVRLKGGLSFEEKMILREKIAVIQRGKERRTRHIEAQRERGAA